MDDFNPYWKITPLFEGDEKSIQLSKQVRSFIKQDPYVPPTVSFSMHTHHLGIKAGSIWASIFGKDLSELVKADLFSYQDLMNFKREAQEGDHSMVKALGVMNKDQKTGRLIMISFREFDAFVNLNPQVLEERTKEYIKIPGKDYLNAYREAGLNIVVLNVNLKDPPFIDPVEVKDASETITQRIYPNT